MGIISGFDLETAIREQLGDKLAPDCQIYISDEDYWQTPIQDVMDLLNRERVDKHSYRSDVHDCDDFAVVLHARMVESSHGNAGRTLPHAFGEVWGYVGRGEDEGGHAVNLMQNADGKVRFLEPQEEPDQAVMDVGDYDMHKIMLIKI